jgi:hypothetical protein
MLCVSPTVALTGPIARRWLARERPERYGAAADASRSGPRDAAHPAISRRTEKAYVGWIRRYILFHGRRHPREMGADEVTRFLTALAVDRKVSASTQNQALAALLFLYGDVLGLRLPWQRPAA